METDRKAYRFFYDNAGWIVGRRAEGALELARAERWAADNGLGFSWEPDYDDCGDGGTTPNERFGCILRDVDGNVLTSLWSIGDPSPEYCRVVEAELALEAMGSVQTVAERHHVFALGMCE